MNLTSKVMKHILEFLYSGRTDGFSSIAAQLDCAPKQYEIQYLAGICRQFLNLKAVPDRKTVLDLLKLAYDQDLAALNQKCLHFMKNMKNI